MSDSTEWDHMRAEYDFSEGVRGKHFAAYRRGATVVVLEPAVAKFFKNSESVNSALKMLIGLAGLAVQKKKTKPRRVRLKK